MAAAAKNTLAVIAGLFLGGVVNMGLVGVGHVVAPLPEGIDGSDLEQLREAMKSFTPMHFLFPLLGHAGGTLAGAFVAAKLAASHPLKLAIGVACFFLLGGISMVVIVGGPLWFIACDLLMAYLPMGLLGGMLGGGKGPRQTD